MNIPHDSDVDLHSAIYDAKHEHEALALAKKATGPDWELYSIKIYRINGTLAEIPL